MIYRKIPKISPGAYIFERPFLRAGLIFGRGLSTEGNLRFKIDLASLIVGRKCTVFEGNLPVFEGNFQVHPPGGGGLYLEGLFNGGFFALRVWGAYIWRGLFSEFYNIYTTGLVISHSGDSYHDIIIIIHSKHFSDFDWL